MWSPDPFGPGAFGYEAGDISFIVHRAALSPAYALRDFKGRCDLRRSGSRSSDLEGGIAAGTACSGKARLLSAMPTSTSARGPCRVDRRQRRHHVRIERRTASTVSSRSRCKATVRDASTISLIRSLHGSGKITLHDARFAGVDTAALDACRPCLRRQRALDAAKIHTASMQRSKAAALTFHRLTPTSLSASRQSTSPTRPCARRAVPRCR